jgi:hypothetical protein
MYQSSLCAINWCYVLYTLMLCAIHWCYVQIHQCHKPIQLKDEPIQLKEEEAEVNTTKRWGNRSKLEKCEYICLAKSRVPSGAKCMNIYWKTWRERDRIPNVQDFVAVTNLHHSSQTREENVVSQGGSVQQFTSLPEELISRFRLIPRTHNSSVPNNASVPQPTSSIRVSSQNFN